MERQETEDRAAVTGAVMALPGGSGWEVLSPTVTEAPHLLTGVAAASPTEIWVVGQARQRPLAARWDGTGWTVPPGPPPKAELIGAGLQGVAVSSSSSGPSSLSGSSGPSASSASSGRAIAVGGGHDRLAVAEVPIIWHWAGSEWAEGDAPELSGGYVLTDVAMFGEHSAWAVGHGFAWGGPPGPVALRWSGNDWRPAPMPSIAKGKLLAVSGTADDDVWAVGAADRDGLIMRYDGDSWSVVSSPSTRFPLTGVAALAPDDVWAVGRDRVLRWNGRKWSRVKTRVTAANTVTALSPTDVWVAGGRGELAHYDGRRWTLAASPDPLGDAAVWLASASLSDAGPDGGVWLAGSHLLTRHGPVDSRSRIIAQSGDTSSSD